MGRRGAGGISLTVQHVDDDGGAGGLAGHAAVIAAVAEGGARYQELAGRAALRLLRLQRHAAPAGRTERVTRVARQPGDGLCGCRLDEPPVRRR